MPTILKTSHILNLRNTSLSLVRFEAAGNLFQRIEYGALKYLPKSLESADMRDNVFSIGKYMPDLRSLPITSLDISNIRSSHNVVTSYIEHCDSRNDTVMIDSENNWLFQQLQYLEMWKSVKYGFPVPRGLKTVSLRNNRISMLSKYAMNGLDSIANINTNLTIDLGGNNLVCKCDSLSFVKWTITTPTYLHHREKYECKTSQNTISLLRNPREVYDTIQKECM
ncbi:Hypothetical predicted protein [Mytilus galloprovincialis]|uniref:Uncharacterized protein n=1 Tax=Mytilus galloprovincialis TaxID=29158 RepID=A0A8B6GNL8_MYTGA|nr:Hypothetical predicted protein [Mytilus galloprovincialis]